MSAPFERTLSMMDTVHCKHNAVTQAELMETVNLEF